MFCYSVEFLLYITEDRCKIEVFGVSLIDEALKDEQTVVEGFSGLNDETSYFFFYFS